MSDGSVGVAVVGAGNISDQYLTNLTAFPDVRVLAVADLDADVAAAAAARFEVPTAGDLDATLRIPEVEMVVNLTPPAAHAEIAAACLEAGKHVYLEKPLAVTYEDGARLHRVADERGLRLGCAPDTFLGAGIQTARRLIDAGAIGTPVAAAAASISGGPESWHPNPAFFYREGAGPLFDIGPYYLTALVDLLGPFARVAATTTRGKKQRVVGSGPRAGAVFDVYVPTHVAGLLAFESGATGAATFSFDSVVARTSFEIAGTEATLALPDPNHFGGPLAIRRAGAEDWEELAISGTQAGRGIGVVDMARGLRGGEPHRASGDLGLHVVSAMSALLRSGHAAEFRVVEAATGRPAELPADWDPAARTL